jgi:tagaturonate epimerase
MHPLPVGIHIYPHSIVEQSEGTYFLANRSGVKYLGIGQDPSGFEAAEQITLDTWLCPLSPINARSLREKIAWLTPVVAGLATSFGFGDRLGLATPGHAQSNAGRGIIPFFAQQSVRENLRTGRTPQQVLDDAMWGVFQSGWKQAWGADADHLKLANDLPPFIAAGYTFFTIDPGDHVDDQAASASGSELMEHFDSLPWNILEDSPQGLLKRMRGLHQLWGGLSLELNDRDLASAAVKYGRAVAHSAEMVRELAALMNHRPFDLEISLDETALPTTPQDHFYVAAEFRRLGVEWVSLAPRFVGRFEKGVDFIGDLKEFAASLRWHAAVANTFGFYRLSLHSGSDKFSIYPAFSEITGNKAHIKTAGTSYLEGLRVVAIVNPALFSEIYRLARERYPQDRASYHVSAELDQMPLPDSGNYPSPSLLDHFHVREVLHVTFGSILDRYGDELRDILYHNEHVYHQTLKNHFEKHLAPFQN